MIDDLQETSKRFPDYEAALWRIIELEGIKPEQPGRVLGLTVSETRVVHAVASREAISRDALISAVYGSNYSGDNPYNTLKVRMVTARRVLKAKGIVIETLWGFGYKMPAESRAKWRAAIDAERLT